MYCILYINVLNILYSIKLYYYTVFNCKSTVICPKLTVSYIKCKNSWYSAFTYEIKVKYCFNITVQFCTLFMLIHACTLSIHVKRSLYIETEIKIQFL